MKKNIITSALVLVILGASASTGYATYRPVPGYIYSINENEKALEIISPKQDIIVQDSLLISVKVRNDVSVSMSVYKEATKEKEEELIIEGEKIDPGETLGMYTKQLKDLEPGKYRIVFDVEDEEGNAQDSIIKNFTVKDKEEEINEILDQIPETKVTNVLDDLKE
ncbi:hypothetical protein [Crassaminicella profunda]|uniref:hypothetical protein n=1 Tax=Crassaminicella profunda TaxID=1286698 RepID=UPI001CA6A22A|nr:hypothetical protein [Crassaminicella profunda]QZY55148.1 hypothetical protein K7H06_19445 [Crassaminicella profunda]